ncbi:MAG: hypothetical protein M5U34_28370 [Chloroflexi bacterium]|nr:hypothetical protein [Chloroflexota bacterium]
MDDMALTYHQLDAIDKAVELNKQSLAIATSIGDQMRVKSVLSHMGRIYLEGGGIKGGLGFIQTKSGFVSPGWGSVGGR